MKLDIETHLTFTLDQPTDVLLQIEAARIPEQEILSCSLDHSAGEHFARVPANDMIGERIWMRAEGEVSIDYRASVEPCRDLSPVPSLEPLPTHLLPGEVVPYLFDSRYCQADRFQAFVDAEFGDSQGGQRVEAIREWLTRKFAYVPGASGPHTTALDSFVERRGVCRDYAHVTIAMARASMIPARYVSLYGPDVDPQDFHAVAEVFLASDDGEGGEWQPVDATGMVEAAEMVKIGVGRDAADVSFLTSFGQLNLRDKTVSVTRG